MRDLKFIDNKVVQHAKINQLEDELGVKFPKEYKALIHKNNGAYPLIGAFYVGELVESINNFHDINNVYHFKHLDLPKGVIPFARDAGDNQICFDYRNENQVSIVFWDISSYKNNGLDMSLVAKSFDDFIEMLFEFEE